MGSIHARRLTPSDSALCNAAELAVIVLLLKIEPRVRMAGLLFNIWLVLHALGRVMLEIFRDDPRGPLMYGLTLGTWMSLVLGLFGVINVLLSKGHRRLV